MLALNDIPKSQKLLGTYAAAALRALVREENAGRKPKRLTEPDHATWMQFRGRLRAPHLLSLLLEDAAVTQPSAFTPPADLGDPSSLPAAVVEAWVMEQMSADQEDAATYIAEQAKLLGLPTRMARSDLHRVKPQHKILELPGSGAQLAHHLVTTHDDIFLQNNFVIACRDWRDVVMVGLVAVELGVSGAAPVVIDPELKEARKDGATFDYVIGLAPDKGGDFRGGPLRELFPNAKVLLV